MKELQKYYADSTHEWTSPQCDTSCEAVYLASEADAAFAEMDQHHKQIVEILETRIANMREQSALIDKQHAEEVERLKAELESMTQEFREQFEAIDLQNERLRKQAERYEKLRKLNPQQFLELWKTNLMGPRFDDLVDQLPASGEAQKQPKTLLDFGYAPGDYFSTCLTCNSQIQDVDKRCYCCKTCAQAKLDKWNGREAQK